VLMNACLKYESRQLGSFVEVFDSELDKPKNCLWSVCLCL